MEIGPEKFSAVGECRADHGHLQRRHLQKALPDGGLAGVAGIPRFAGQRADGFAAQVDPRAGAQAERVRRAEEGVCAEQMPQVAEVGVARLLDGLAERQRSMPIAIPAVEAHVAQNEYAGAVVGVVRRPVEIAFLFPL